MTQATTQVVLTSQTIAVEHITIASKRPFAEVRRKLEGVLPKLDASIAEALRRGDQKRSPAATRQTTCWKCWWRTQSISNLSQHPNSLLTGKLTGISQNSAFSDEFEAEDASKSNGFR
jgi:hypothetical protein